MTTTYTAKEFCERILDKYDYAFSTQQLEMLHNLIDAEEFDVWFDFVIICLQGNA